MVINSISSPANSVRLEFSSSPLDFGSRAAKYGTASSNAPSLTSFQWRLEEMIQKIKLENERSLIPEKDRPHPNDATDARQTDENFDFNQDGRLAPLSFSEISALERSDPLLRGALNLLA